ncbi:hypothetical protein [Longimicrobium sp.]|uniref:hypothetical protein n=1 Tax=Longimicrobium sp. TaxID=2029185 RepID=UPI002C5AA754|nr:hypothetical protein [Longimicrobium sp.]HSU12610.1 hypothetical protein [Longimicrobium sp.]
MPRVSIQQFRASLAGRGDANADVRAYRELGRRPAVAAEAGFAAWGDWAAPPSRGA